jgi:hypothetical protein
MDVSEAVNLFPLICTLYFFTLNFYFMLNFKLTIKHDSGKFTVKTSATSEAAAIGQICAAYNCPPFAIKKIESFPIFYKVVKLYRISRRRQILARNLSEAEAQRIVQSFPDSSRSMVIYQNINRWLF